MATILTPHIDYTSKDYEAFRNDMLNLIPFLMPEYTDFSQSDAGVMLIELNAYMGDILSYYQDRQANEVYLPTATQRQSVLDIVKQLSYRLRNAVPSSSELVVELVDVLPSDFIIPKGFSVSTEGGEYEEAITFETTADLVIPKGAIGNEKDEDGNYLYTVAIVQGITIPNEIVGSSNGQPQQRFRLQYQNVIDDSVDIYINEGAGFVLWSDITNTDTGSTVDGKQYIRETDEDGYTYIVFGDGLNGKIPAIGADNIVGSYRIGGGTETNVGANSITVVNSNLAGIEQVYNPIAATGGMDRESIEEAKQNAPKLFKTQARAVTKEDYENIAKSVPGVAKAIAVADPNLLNTIHITIAPNGGGQPSPKLIQDVSELLDDRKIITTQVFMENPIYVYAQISLDVVLEDNWSQQELRTYIISSLKTLFDFNTQDFGQGMPIGRIYREIMNLNGIYSLIVKQNTLVPLIEWPQVTGNPTFSSVTLLPALTYSGEWQIKMTSATNFTVSQLTVDGGGQTVETPKGTGTMGTLFTDTSNSIQFLLTAGNISCTAGDYWKFRTIPYLSDLAVNPYEILLLDEEGLTINLTGGRP